MGISKFFGDVLSVPNLFRNGGLDFQDDRNPLPPFYTIAGALRPNLAEGGESVFYQVFNEIPDSPLGATNYIRVAVNSKDPVTIGQDFSTSGGILDHVYPTDPILLQPFGYQAQENNLIYQGEYTISFAVRVLQGEVSVGFSVATPAGGSGIETTYTELIPRLSSKEWRRFTGVFTAPNTKLGVVGVQIQRRGLAQTAEVHVGNIMLARGGYDELPYNGDPAAAVFPRGAIIMCMGTMCPPGFVPVGDSERYPKEGPPGDVGGSSHHEHDLIQKMEPEDNWPRRSLLDGSESGDINNLDDDSGSFADPADFHEHPIRGDGQGNNTEPVYRGYLFCRRA